MNHHQQPNVHAELTTLEPGARPAPSTVDDASLQRLIEYALCDIIKELAVNVEQARAEVEQLHKAWNLQRDEIRQLRTRLEPAGQPQTGTDGDAEHRFSGDLADTTIEDGPSAPPEPTEWRTGDPEPPADTVRAVRGHRTKRLYFRETDAQGGRWIHRQSGDWCRWDYLLHFEQSAHLFNVGGTS